MILYMEPRLLLLPSYLPYATLDTALKFKSAALKGGSSESRVPRAEWSSFMNMLKRIMAMAGVILVSGIWIATLVIALTGGSQKLLTAFIVLSVLVPVLIYGILLVGKVVSGRPVKDEFDKAERDRKKN